MYVNVRVRLLVHVSLTCHPAPLRQGEVVLFSVSGDRMEKPPLLFFLLIFFNLPLGHPLPSSQTILSPFPSAHYHLPSAVLLTCMTDIDVHCIYQMWHVYLSPLDRSAVRTRSDSLVIHKLAMCHVVKRYIRSQGFHSALIPVHTDGDEVMWIQLWNKYSQSINPQLWPIVNFYFIIVIVMT